MAPNAFDTIEELVRRMDEDTRLARNTLARLPDAFPPLGIVPGLSAEPTI